MTSRSTLFLCLLISSFYTSIHAQPGWVDFSSRYFYRIQDKEGKDIQFSNNKKYTIMIDSLSFSGSSIPCDSLTPTIEWSTDFYDYIRINDFSLSLPKNDRFSKLSIRIIHKKDTMYLNQPTGSGGLGIFITPHEAETEDLRTTLQFVPGHYYFPGWAHSLLYKLPKTKGSVTINNIHSRNFIIPRSIYDSLALHFMPYKRNRALTKKAEEYVLTNFSSPGLKLTRKTKPIQFDRSFLPYKRRNWSGPLYPTSDSTIYFGQIDYVLDTTNLYSSKKVFSLFDTKTNSIQHYTPREDIHLFYSGYLYIDSFNHVLYQTAGIREKFAPECDYWRTNDCPYTTTIFRSTDSGKTWKEDLLLKQFFLDYSFRDLVFIDKDHALGFSRREIKNKKRYQQGIYYLIRNGRIIDSLKTPKGVHYNDNYNHHSISRSEDSLYLGSWGIDPYNINNSPFFRPLLVKNQTNWDFLIREYKKRQFPKTKQDQHTVTEYHNFQLINQRQLVFKNGAGSLLVNSDIRILEQKQLILILDNDFTYISFDGGTSWYLYPKPLDERGSYTLLHMSGSNTMSFFDLNRMERVSYLFSNGN